MAHQDVLKPQLGDIGLPQGPIAEHLLASNALAHVANDGTPRALPSYFHWAGDGGSIGATTEQTQ